MVLACSVRLCLCVGFERGRQGVVIIRGFELEIKAGRERESEAATRPQGSWVFTFVCCACVCLGDDGRPKQPEAFCDFVHCWRSARRKKAACAV